MYEMFFFLNQSRGTGKAEGTGVGPYPLFVTDVILDHRVSWQNLLEVTG